MVSNIYTRIGMVSNIYTMIGNGIQYIYYDWDWYEITIIGLGLVSNVYTWIGNGIKYLY